ncbi:MAG: stage II sporulation protein M [Candidatus Methanomethyliaceae archaeon]|nr:stage II sporulation protein M [Candidatus Methanomethyliaceae archaeon]
MTMGVIGVIKANKYYLLISTLLITAGIIAGAAVPQGGALSEDPLFKDLMQYTQFYKPYEPLTVLFLLAKNSIAAALAFLFAPILLLAPVGVLLLNGFLLGMVGSGLAAELSPIVAVGAFAPHGIFEIPALIFACAAGLRFGIASFRKLISFFEHKKYSLYTQFMEAWGLFILSLMLFLVAAIMETYVTPFVLGYLY